MTTNDSQPNSYALDLLRGRRSLVCPQCGYDLRGATESRCPECGLHYDREAIRRIASSADAKQYRAAHLTLALSALSVILILGSHHPPFWSPAVMASGGPTGMGCFLGALRIALLIACVWILMGSFGPGDVIPLGTDSLAALAVAVVGALWLVPMAPALFRVVGIICLLAAWFQRFRFGGQWRHAIDNISPGLRQQTIRLNRKSWIVLGIATGISIGAMIV